MEILLNWKCKDIHLSTTEPRTSKLWPNARLLKLAAFHWPPIVEAFSIERSGVSRARFASIDCPRGAWCLMLNWSELSTAVWFIFTFCWIRLTISCCRSPLFSGKYPVSLTTCYSWNFRLMFFVQNDKFSSLSRLGISFRCSFTRLSSLFLFLKTLGSAPRLRCNRF